MPSLWKIFASLGAAAALSAPAGAQGVVTEKNVSLALAQTIANAALKQCKSMGFKVSAAVVDRGGHVVVLLQHGDGAGLHTQERPNARLSPHAPSASRRPISSSD